MSSKAGTDIAPEDIVENPVDTLNNSHTIRRRAYRLLELGMEGQLDHFDVDIEKMESLADFVCDVIEENYPDLDIPYHSRWRHFEYGGCDRWAMLKEQMALADRRELARRAIDLTFASVLLDAGAGPDWVYKEPGAENGVGRSEGLGLASFYMFWEGNFSSDPAQPFQVDAGRLETIKPQDLARGFQSDNNNPLSGLEGRAELLAALGRELKKWPEIFGIISQRPGHMLDYLAGDKKDEQSVAARDILKLILECFAPIWPGRLQIYGTNLGDVWRHGLLEYEGQTNHLMPFHKLSQWLTYSLLEPFEWAGITVTGIDELTGLAEYRNGGLFVDGGVLIVKDEEAAHKPHNPGDEIIVEWRALTIALLDELRVMVADRMGLPLDKFPLARLLQGGTWEAGRILAAERDPEFKEPPLEIISDGTVF